MNLDELELELRKLPGVRWAAFSEHSDRSLVQLHAAEDASSELTVQATRIAARHCDVPVAVEVVRRRDTPARGVSDSAVPANGASSVPPDPPTSG